LYLLQKTDQLDDDIGKANFFIQLCRTLRYYLDIEPFHNEIFLNKQFDLLDGVVLALYLAKTQPIEKFPILARRTESATRMIKVNNKSVALYKQRITYAKEAFMWEICSLFNLDSFIAPSCPIYIHGQMATYQPFMKASSLGQTLYGFYEPNMNVKTENYFLATLLAMLFGHRDLHTQNIGITKKNDIVFWDNESILPENNEFISLELTADISENSLNVPFVSYLNDWPQANYPLPEKERAVILSHISKWDEYRKFVEEYLLHPYTEIELTQDEKKAFFDRYEAITKNLLSSNLSIKELTPLVYPHYGQGMDFLISKLAPLVSNPDIKMMQAYLFIGNGIKWWKNISPEQKKELIESVGILMELFYSSFFIASQESSP
jgi:hypothetical protein